MDILTCVSTWIEATMTSGAAAIVDIGLKGALVLALAAVMAHALRRSSAAVRHLVWSAALVGLLALPALSFVVPQWRVPAFASITLTTPNAGRGVAATAVTTARDEASPAESASITRASPEPAFAPISVKQESASGEAPAKRATDVAASGTAPAAPRAGVDVAAVIGRLSLGAWLFLVWLVGAAAVLGWVALGSLMNWWLARSAREVTSGPVLDLVDELSYELGIGTTVTLLHSDSRCMPRTWGLEPKVLLPCEVEEWSDQRLRAVLLHELAHVKRHDYLTQLLGHVAVAIHWFNPLVWYAVRRMRVERERACDDRVLSTGSKASDYAEHLLDIARSLKMSGFASATSVAMARRSQLSDRLLDVLDATRRRTAVSSRMAGMVWTAAALVVVPVSGMTAAERVADHADHVEAVAVDPVSVAPGDVAPARAIADVQSQGCDWYGRGENTSTSIQSNDGLLRITIEKDDCQLRIEAEGEIQFNDAETDVVYLAPDGMFEIEEREGRTRRRLEIDTDRSGELRYRWFVGGDEQPYDSAARQWFADLLPLVFRRGGLQAEERAGRILERAGVDGVLQEISQIPSDYVARKYFEVLLTDASLSEQQLRQIVQQAGRELESDYELAELLIRVAQSHPVDRAVQIAYVEAAGHIDSDYETRRVLDAVLDRPGLDQEVAQAMLQLATEIDSDYELAELLIGMMQRHPIQETLTPEFFEAVGTLESDYEHRRVLQATLEHGAPNQQVLDMTLASAMGLDSDYELAELLIQVGNMYPTDRAIPDSYMEAAGSLDSDYERRRVLGVLIERGQLSEASLTQLLNAATLIDSDYELAETLIGVVGAYELSEATYEPFFRSVRELDSDYELSRVLQALLEREQPNDALVEAVLNASTSIASDHELSTLLVKVAETYSLNDRLRTMYIDAAEGISSQYERDRALAALVRRGGIQ
jgi:beta-lactamase regulating signal transducer with metallopeptidase domain